LTSMQRIEANRQNAQRSTGPKTAEGKARVAQNARTHGLFARQSLLPDEDPQELEDLRESVRADLNPEGTQEECLVELMVDALWRRRRLGRVEAGIYSFQQGNEPTATLGLKFMRGAGAFTTLSRYESALERSYYRALHELQRLQEARRGGHVPTPLALDVTVSGQDDSGTDRPIRTPVL